jgi:hypothetical protein
MKFRSIRRLLLAVALTIMVPQATEARVVGVVFDDSGSMKSRIHLPTFGVQMLTSTLDTQSGRDVLLTLRLSKTGAGVVEENIASTSALQTTIDNIRREWANADGGTPYQPIESMMQRMVQKLRPGETGTLFILTDGQIDRPPAVPEMQRKFDAFKQELDAKKAAINVEFMLIAVGTDRETVRKAVAEQKVRETLLERFNGNRRDPQGRLLGDHEVTDIRDLFNIMKEIVARISETDVSRIGNYVSYAGNSVTVTTPVSVVRIVSIAKAINVPPPVIERRNFEPSASFSIGSRMAQADAALPGQAFRANTEQMIFQPALPDGQHTLTFSGSAQENVFLVFETNARVEISVFNPDNTEVQKDNSGAYVLVRNRDYRLVEILVDETEKGRRVVPLSTLKGQSRFSATIDEAGGARQTYSLEIVPNENRAVTPLRIGKVGNLIARGKVQLDGFVSPVSNATQLRVIEGTLKVGTSIKPSEPCADCPAGTIKSTVGAAGPDVPVATVDLIPEGEIQGKAKLDLSGLPAGIGLVDQNGARVADGAEIDLVPKRPLHFRIVRPARPLTELLGKPLNLAVRLRGDPTVGNHAVEGTLFIAVPDAKLIHTATTGTSGDTEYASLNATKIVDGAVRFAFKVEGNLGEVSPADFSIADPLWLTTLKREASGNGVIVTPHTRYVCVCFLWLDRGSHSVDVVYSSSDGLQKATASVPFSIDPTWREILFGCLFLLLMLLLLAWAIGVVINTWNARRFPSESFLEIDEGHQLPRHVLMRGRNWTFLRALFWPLFGRPDEHRVMEGLDLTAGNRLHLLVRRDAEDLNVRGEWLSERFSFNEKIEHLKFELNWQETVQKRGPPTISIRCCKSAGDSKLDP